MAKKARKQEKPKIERIAMVSHESIVKHTRKSWDEWIAILDAAGARNMTYREIAAFIKKKYKLTMWWQGQVTICYEIYIGRRAVGVNSKGEFAMTSTKSFGIDHKALWKLISSSEGQAIWLKPLGPFTIKPKSFYETENGVYGEVRTMVAGKRIRMTWHDTDWLKASVLQIYVVPRPKGKSILVFQQEKLPTGRARLQMKDYWRQALEELFSISK